MATARVARSRNRGDSSWLKKLLLWVVLPIGLVWFVVWWRVNAAVDELFESMQSYATVTHGRAFVGLGGDVGVTSVAVTGVADGTPFRAGTVTLHTPSLLWVIRTGLFGISDMPERFGVSVDDFELVGQSRGEADDIIGMNSAAPFDAAGCFDHGFARTELIALGIAEPRATMRFDYELGVGNDVTVRAMQSVYGSATTNATIRFALGADPRENPAAFATAAVRGFELTTTDEGFVAARNKACAAQHKLAVDAFVDRHVAAARAVLRAHGVAMADADWAAYRKFARNGGNVSVRGMASRPVPPAELVGGLNGLQAFSLQLVDAQGTAQPLSLRQVEPVPLGGLASMTLEQQIEAEMAADRAAADELRRTGGVPGAPATPATTPATTATATATTAAPPAAPPAAATAPSTPAVEPAGRPTTSLPLTAPPTRAAPRVLASAAPDKQPAGTFVDTTYDELAGHIGHEVRVTTRHGTVRAGTLVKHSRFGIDIKLGARDGGITLSVAANEVKAVSVAPPPPPAPAAAAQAPPAAR